MLKKLICILIAFVVCTYAQFDLEIGKPGFKL